MKVIYWLTVLAALPGMALAAFLGVSYVTEGQGMHPCIAAVLTLVLGLIGWFAACRADKEEDELNLIDFNGRV